MDEKLDHLKQTQNTYEAKVSFERWPPRVHGRLAHRLGGAVALEQGGI